MNILFIYRNSAMGFSVGKVFKPIEFEICKYANVDSLELPIANYSFKGLWTNISYLRKHLKRASYDAVLITGTENYLLPFISSSKKVVVVHDVQSFFNNLSGMRRKLKELMFIKVLGKADKIVSISEQTQNELIAYGFRSAIIYDPVSPTFTYVNKVFNKVCPIVLHIGTNSNKNLHNTILALKGLKCFLRIVGKLSTEDLKSLHDNDIEYSCCSNISDEELLEEYRCCDIVNFPSLYEGFGMPIIEGQATGRVVVTSNISPMKEVAGGASVLVNPHDVLSIRKGYLEAIKNSDQYIEKGLENVKRFTVSSISSQYFNLIKELLV
mgnify:CR=1 FL=1